MWHWLAPGDKNSSCSSYLLQSTQLCWLVWWRASHWHSSPTHSFWHLNWRSPCDIDWEWHPGRIITSLDGRGQNIIRQCCGLVQQPRYRSKGCSIWQRVGADGLSWSPPKILTLVVGIKGISFLAPPILTSICLHAWLAPLILASIAHMLGLCHWFLLLLHVCLACTTNPCPQRRTAYSHLFEPCRLCVQCPTT